MSTTPLHVELAEAMAVPRTGPTDAAFIYVGSGQLERRCPPYDELDPGIRETVRWLYEHGFNPCDSGDGVSKPKMACAFEQPHVFMTCHVPLEGEVDRLQGLLEAKGVHLFNGPMTAEEAEELGVNFIEPPPGAVSGYITGSYSPGQAAMIEVFGVNDTHLE